VGPQGESPHSTLFTLRLNFDEDDGAPSGKKGMELPKEGHHLKGGGTKGMTTTKLCVHNKCFT